MSEVVTTNTARALKLRDKLKLLVTGCIKAMHADRPKGIICSLSIQRPKV